LQNVTIINRIVGVECCALHVLALFSIKQSHDVLAQAQARAVVRDAVQIQRVEIEQLVEGDKLVRFVKTIERAYFSVLFALQLLNMNEPIKAFVFLKIETLFV
jgi:hypothetical protein